MDELDRMFRRLVENIRNGYPELLTQPFEVSELFQTIIPYRHNRKELAIDTNEEYELTLCRLLAGERSYMGGDDVMRETIREQLGGSNPNTAIYREFASSRVAIVADAVRRLDSGGAPSRCHRRRRVRAARCRNHRRRRIPRPDRSADSAAARSPADGA